MQNYCMNCMKELGGSPVCSNCGYDNGKPGAHEPYHLAPGTVLAGKYLVGNALGEGGFGITYIGMHTTLNKRVAIKEFYPSGTANRISLTQVQVTGGKEEFFQKGVQRFLDEAKNVAKFSEEDGIVDIIDYFQENNTAYIVMEYLEGETLKQYVYNHGVFPIETLVSLMIPLMNSLSAVHAAGVIHRDISPDNIMYCKNKLKLMDFGSARYFTNKERQMSVILKQGFAPEEQYRTNGVQGPYTDVYALCATMYACITNTVPIGSLDRITNDTLKRPSELGVKIPPYMENALMHGLAVYAKDRTPDIPTLLNEITTETTQYQPPVSKTVIPPEYAQNMWRQEQSIPKTTAPDTGNSYTPQTAAPDMGNSYTPQTTAPDMGNSYTPQTTAPDPGSSYTPQTTAPEMGSSYTPQTTAPEMGSSYTPQTTAPNMGNSYTPQTTAPNMGNSYMPDNSYMPPMPPAQKKSKLPLILGITIPVIVAAAAVVIIIIALNNGGGSKNDGGGGTDISTFISQSDIASSGTDSSSGTESSSGGLSSGDDSSAPTLPPQSSSESSSSISFDSSSSSQPSQSPSAVGFDVNESKTNAVPIAKFFLKHILDGDSKAKAGDYIQSKELYFCEADDTNYRRLVYVYYNSTQNYYCTLEHDPDNMYLQNGEVFSKSSYFSSNKSASTLEQAKKNVMYISSTTGRYEVTKVG